MPQFIFNQQVHPQQRVININNSILVSPSPFAPNEIWDNYRKTKQEFDNENKSDEKTSPEQDKKEDGEDTQGK